MSSSLAAWEWNGARPAGYRGWVLSSRRCSKTPCGRSASTTLTYSYGDQQAVLGPLSAVHVPGTHDLCAEHAASLVPPRGWDIVRLPVGQTPEVRAGDLAALADAVRQAALRYEGETVPARAGRSHPDPDGVVEVARRGHLTVITDAARRHG